MKYVEHLLRWRMLICFVGVIIVLAGCQPTPAAQPLAPTRTPLPTFTPTPEGPVIDVAATEAAMAAAATATSAAPVATDTPVEPPTPAEPAPTATPEVAQATVSQGMNIRSGPGTNYQVIGAAQAGDRFVIKGKDPTGAWWQVDYNGRDGWVFGQLVSAQNTGAVAVAQNIPAPPPPTATPVPQPTQPPAQPAQPTAPPAPAKNYKFNVVVVSRCERQPAGNWFEGRTYIGGQPANGYKVVFSYAPDAPPITEPMISGPHPGYPGWNTGYYSHIINANGPKAGDWYVWIVDDAGNRISEIGKWTSTGPGEGCNQAVVDFDSR